MGTTSDYSYDYWIERALTAESKLEELREKYAVFDPVCRKCGDPLTTDELICENCR